MEASIGMKVKEDDRLATDEPVLNEAGFVAHACHVVLVHSDLLQSMATPHELLRRRGLNFANSPRANITTILTRVRA
jgi:hypothetical protein